MIYHITTREKWEKALNSGVYTHEDLQKEGFIHCSTKEQLIASAEKHYAAFDELVILCIVEKRVKEILKWEPSRGGQLFPHVYGTIPLEAVESQNLLVKNEVGKFEWV